MTTASKISNLAKVRLQKVVVESLRRGGRHEMRRTWDDMMLNKEFESELESYDLLAPQRRSHLFGVAFPDCTREELKQVNAALDAGNNLNDLYALACGLAYIETDVDGGFVKGKKGLKILRHRKS